MEQESLFELIQQATAMLQDRTRVEADLIYYVAKMHDEERTAIILAYQGLYNDQLQRDAKSTRSR